jgi:hypothetical protein
MTTWYVTPETGGGTPIGAGSSSDPWNGFSNITWGAGGVVAGATLDLGGNTFDEGALFVTEAGTSGNPITIQNGTIDGNATTGCFSTAQDYITLDNVNCTNGDPSATAMIKIGSTISNPTGVIVKNCNISGGGYIGISCTGVDFLIDNCTTDDSLSDDSCQINNGAADTTSGTIQYCNFITKSGTAGDCIQLNPVGSGDIIIKDNILTKNDGTKNVIEISSCAGNTYIKDNTCTGLHSGYCIHVDNNVTGNIYFDRNYLYKVDNTGSGNWIIATDAPTTTPAYIKVTGNIFINGFRAVQISDEISADINNNTFIGAYRAVSSTSAAASASVVKIKNNIFDDCYYGPYNLGNETTFECDYNIYNDVTEWWFDNTRYLTFALSQSSGYETNGDESDPQLDANYYPTSTSPCVGTGVKWWSGANPVGYDGEPFADFETDIGAVQGKHSILHPTKL